MSPSIWRFEEFLEGRTNRLPFEMEYVECFRGTSREILMDKSCVESDKFGDDNVLRLGYLIASDMNAGSNPQKDAKNSFEVNKTASGELAIWKRDYKRRVKEKLRENSALDAKEKELNQKAERVWKEFLRSGRKNRLPAWDEPLDTRRQAVYFSNEVVAENYARNKSSIILKAHIPSNECWLVDRYRGEGNNVRIPNMNELKKHYNREEFRNRVRETSRGKSDIGIQVVVGKEVPLEWISGIKDTDISDDYLSKSKYVKMLNRYFAHEMEELNFWAKNEKLTEELEILEAIHNIFGKLHFYLEEYKTVIDRFFPSHIESRNYWGKNYEFPEKRKKGSGSCDFAAGDALLRKDYLTSLDAFLEKSEKISLGDKVKGEGYIDTRRELLKLMFDELEHFQQIDSSRFYEGYQDRSLNDIVESNQLQRIDAFMLEVFEIIEFCEKAMKELEEIREKAQEEDFSPEKVLDITERKIVSKVDNIKGISEVVRKMDQVRDEVENEIDQLEKTKFENAYRQTHYIKLPVSEWKKLSDNAPG